MRFDSGVALSALVLFASPVLGCSDEAAPPVDAAFGDIRFPTLGPLSSEDGKGHFRFGAASAATQIEDDNAASDWFVFTQPKSEGGLAQGKAFVGDASKGYSMAIEDVELLSDLGLESYRFSMEWARIEPQRDVIDEEAIAHYGALLDALIAAGIRPVVTLHHFSNPIWVDDPRDLPCEAGPTDENLCGLGDPIGGPLIVKEMADHAQLLAERFGDRVDEWGTLNEPMNYLLAAYGIGAFPPGKNSVFSLIDDLMPIVRSYLSAHAAMYAAIKAADTTDADGDGDVASVGLSLSAAEWVASQDNEPSTDPLDVAARDRLVYLFQELVVESLREGTFDLNVDGTPELEEPSWKGTLDWLGVQYYMRAGVTGTDGLLPMLNLTPCYGGFDLGSCVPPVDPTFCVPAMRYEHWAPGLYNVLAAYAKRWPDLPLLVSEAGIATSVGERRAENIVRALEQIARARADGIDVRGYYHWSLYDNFEWTEGFEPRFGLYAVDSASYARTPTLGAEVLGDIAKTRKVTKAQREAHGGTGPMTPESSEQLENCAGD